MDLPSEILSYYQKGKEAGRLLTRKAARMAEAESAVGPILEAVRKRGDAALIMSSMSRLLFSAATPAATHIP